MFFCICFVLQASMYSSHLSPGIIINLHIKSVNTLFHRCYSWLCNKMLYSKSRNPGMKHVDCVETFHGILIVSGVLFSFKKTYKQKKHFSLWIFTILSMELHFLYPCEFFHIGWQKHYKLHTSEMITYIHDLNSHYYINCKEKLQQAVCCVSTLCKFKFRIRS